MGCLIKKFYNTKRRMESSKEKDYKDFGLISFIKPNYDKDSFQSLFERGTHNGYVAIPQISRLVS